MRKFTLVNMLLAFVLILGSCATNKNVVSNKLISKRKYTKGFHINKKSHHKDSKGDVAYEEVSVESNKKTEGKVKVNRKAKKQLKNEISVSSEAIAFVELEENAVDYAESVDGVGMTSDGIFDGDISMQENAEVTNESDSSNNNNENHKEVAKLSKKASGGGGRGDLMYILILILLILAIIALLSLVGGVLGQILGLVVLILIIYFLLKLLGVI